MSVQDFSGQGKDTKERDALCKFDGKEQGICDTAGGKGAISSPAAFEIAGAFSPAVGSSLPREKKRERVILPGTYDPVTLGHLAVIRRAAEEYEEVFVTVFVNPQKTPTFSLSERMAMLMLATDEFDNVLVTESSGLVIDYMREHRIGKILKGYRNETDLSYEKAQAEWNFSHGGVTTELIPCEDAYRTVSSTLARRLLAEGGDLSGVLPEKVIAFLKNR